MPTTLVLALVLQQLAVEPYPCEVGAGATVRATAPGGPIVGLALSLQTTDGGVRDLGVTDANGELRFVPEREGTLRVSGVHAGVRLVAPLEVVPVPPRWLYALVCVPLGVYLLIRNLRRSRA
jgi:hypothetical protein